jgi:hypothetical protein
MILAWFMDSCINFHCVECTISIKKLAKYSNRSNECMAPTLQKLNELKGVYVKVK